MCSRSEGARRRSHIKETALISFQNIDDYNILWGTSAEFNSVQRGFREEGETYSVVRADTSRANSFLFFTPSPNTDSP